MAMGLRSEKILFDGGAPDIQRIAAKVAELSGLAVQIRHKLNHNMAELYELDAWLAFECAPGERVQLVIYREDGYSADEVAMADGDFGLDGQQSLNAGADGRYVEPPGKQTLRVRQKISAEPTFRNYVFLALEALGGEFEQPLEETARALCASPITALELERRKWKRFGRELVHAVYLGFIMPFYLVMYMAFGIEIVPFFQTSDQPRPPQHRRHVLLRIAGFPFKLLFAILGAAFLALYLPLLTLFVLVAFAWKSARLAFHMLTQAR